VKDLESSEVFGETNVPSVMPPTQSEPLFRCRVIVTYDQAF